MAETERASLFRARGFRAYLLAAFGVLAVTLVGAVGYAQNRRLEQALVNATDHELRLMAEGLTQQTGDALAFHTIVLEALAALIETNAPGLDHDALERTVFGHYSRFGELGVFYVANGEDVAVFSDSPDSKGYSIEGTWYGDREYVRAMREANHTVVGDVQVGRRTGVAAVPLATPLRGTGGAPGGYIAETLRLDQFERVLRRAIEQLPEGRAVLLDAKGHVIAETGRPDSADQALGALPLFTAPQEGPSLRSSVDEVGVRVRIASQKVTRAGWTLYVMQPTSVVERQLAAAGRQTLVGAIVALGLALLAARLLAALLARPIIRLAEFARSARGETALSTDAAPDPWEPAEVQALHSTLREMVDRMQRHAHDLEDQVEARTRALAESNRELTASLERQQEIHDQLLQTAKLAAVGQLAAGFAHEINNPLGVIIGFGQALQRRLPPDSPLGLPVASILREGQRCRDLVTEMLTFSRRSKPKVEPVDLNALVAATTVLLETRAHQQSVRLKQGLAPELPAIWANKTQLQQVLVNLATNALDAMPEGGTLTLSTRRLPDGGLAMQVADTGSGIPPEVRSRIFEPFFTTKELGRGTGLGLSLVYEIVTQHGGHIDVDSAEGKGTVIAVNLPVQAPRVEQPLVQ